MEFVISFVLMLVGAVIFAIWSEVRERIAARTQSKQ
jgi:hypothetical protein